MTSLFGLAPQPLFHGIAHGLGPGALHPSHEGAIELEMIAALLSEEAPDVLHIPVGLGDRRLAGDGIAVPVERLQSCLPLDRWIARLLELTAYGSVRP